MATLHSWITSLEEVCSKFVNGLGKVFHQKIKPTLFCLLQGLWSWLKISWLYLLVILSNALFVYFMYQDSKKIAWANIIAILFSIYMMGNVLGYHSGMEDMKKIDESFLYWNMLAKALEREEKENA